MNEELVLDITDIQIIVHKTEEKNFRFFNPKRGFDGFVMLTEGSGFVTDKNGKQYGFSKGDMLIASEGDQYLLEFEEPCSYVTSGLTLCTNKEQLPFIFKCKERQVKEILKICDVWQARGWNSYQRCRISLLNFYLEVLESNVLKEKEDGDISKAIRFIHENFKRNFSGEEIAEYASLSLSYLRSKFLSQTGKTIIQYRDGLRMAAAKEMLESNYFSIKEIALELGYCDVYHFSKMFSFYAGVSPARWKENLKNK